MGVCGRYMGTNGPSLPLVFASSSGVAFPNTNITIRTTDPGGITLLGKHVGCRAVNPSGLGRLHRTEVFRGTSTIGRRVGGLTSVLHPGFSTILGTLGAVRRANVMG